MNLPLEQFPYVLDGRKTNGQPIFHSWEELCANLQNLKYSMHMTIQEIAGKLGISHTTVHRLCVEEHLILPHHNRLKPKLTEENKLLCFKYCLDKRDVKIGFMSYEVLLTHCSLKGSGSFLCKMILKHTFYLEKPPPPHHTIQHKSHILK